MITLYGINNCDTVRKAKRWLQERGFEVVVHDFRSDGLERKLLSDWLAKGSPQNLVNRRSTTWKQLGAEQREAIQQGLASGAPQRDAELVQLLLDNPTLLKRPVVHRPGDAPLVGFSPDSYATLCQDTRR